jgi:hypothetical protein
LSITSSNPESDYHDENFCQLRIWTPKVLLDIRLPNWIVTPHTKRVYPPTWGYDTVVRLGRNWYDLYTPREYGVWYADKFLMVMYGIQSHDSSTEQNKGWFIPWLDTRHVRHTFYDENHNKICDAPEWGFKFGDNSWDNYQAVVDSLPKTTLSFKDYDGELVEVKCYIEEREWRYGTGWFKWLGTIRKPLIQRTVNLQFSKEMGRRKGTWKGGTLGHGCVINPGESIYEAFLQYALDNELTHITQL